MSVRVMAAVFDRYPNGGGEMVLALALADHADDTGGSIFPSVATLAKKTRQSKRSVQYQLRKMQDMGWLVLVAYEGGGRGRSREYSIHSEWVAGTSLNEIKNNEIGEELKGASFALFTEEQTAQYLHPIYMERVQPTTQRVQPTSPKGATAIAPEPSVTIREPSIQQLPAREGEFLMHLDWQPSDLFVDLMARSGVLIENIPKQNFVFIVVEFITYWISEEVALTQKKWVLKFVQRVIDAHRRGKLYATGQQRSSRRDDIDWEDTSWIDDLDFIPG